MFDWEKVRHCSSKSFHWILRVFLLCGLIGGINCREYYGKFIGNFNTYAHKVAGKVYAVDEDTIFIKGFSYDGIGPDAFFWVGKDNQPSPNGMVVPYPDDYTEKAPPTLEFVDREDVMLQLPPGLKLKEIKWLSVWCRRFTVNFGDVYIPSTLDPPKRKILPEFTREAHGLKSGNITILDAKTFYIPNLHYDGAGPDAFFWVGTGPGPHPGGRKIPNEKGSTEVLSGYQGEDIELTLPGDLTVFDIDWLSMWCISYKHNFGHVLIPKNLNIPPALGQYRKTPFFGYFPQFATTRPIVPRHHEKKKKKNSEFRNCRELSFSNHERKRAQIQWEKDENVVKFKVTAKIGEDQYFALGFSPVKGLAKMVGGDAIVIYYTPTERKKFHAVDYFMTAKSQCDGRDGVCPDARIGGSDDVKVHSGDRKNGFTTVIFERPINTRESRYDISLEDEVNIMIAIGSLNGRKEANFHHGERTSESEDIRISVQSIDDHTCLLGDDFANTKDSQEESKYRPWPPAVIDDGSTNFTVRIGPTGGKRGYTAITGSPSWGIAWWVNELLIPEIYVERGKTYIFKVQGGDDPKNPSKYHPLYITDNPEGGYGQRREYDQKQQRVFAGVGKDSSGYPYPTAVGQYCEYEHKTVDKSAQSESFEEYKKTLKLVCSDDGVPGYLSWTVTEDTPDTVYYQCYTHNNLGWKIRVVNPGFRLRRDSYSSGASVASSLSLLAFTAMFKWNT